MKKGYLVFLIGAFFFKISYAYSQGVSNEQAQVIANNLLISKNYKAGVQKILSPINNIQVVLLIILNKIADRWSIIFEALAPGIQDKTSKLLDWHVKGSGVDFTLGNSLHDDFQNEKLRKAIETSIGKDDVVLIPYQHFIHMNTAEKASPKKHTPYTIDKTHYFDFANVLFDDKYKEYPKNECMMFDTPQITECQFSYLNALYTVRALTDNNQIWTYTFSGIDTQNKYLLNKSISVKKGTSL